MRSDLLSMLFGATIVWVWSCVWLEVSTKSGVRLIHAQIGLCSLAGASSKLTRPYTLLTFVRVR